MKPISFTKVAIKKFAELANPKGTQFFIGETAQVNANLFIARDANGSEVILRVDDDNLRLFAYEILSKVGHANN